MPLDQGQSLPPSLTGAPKPGYSPASTSAGNPGAMAASLSQIGLVVKQLQGVIQNLPIGSAPHKAVMESITKLSKIVPSGDQMPGVQKTAMMGMQKNLQQQQPYMAMLQSMGKPQGMSSPDQGGGQQPPAAA